MKSSLPALFICPEQNSPQIRKGKEVRKMSKMVYLPYVRFEQEEGEPKGNGWYFTQYNAETGEGRGWHGTEFMPDCLFETKYEGGEPETKFFDVNTNEPIKQWSWPEPPDDNAFTNYGSLDEFVANNLQKVFRIVDCNKEAQDCPCMIYGRLSTMIELADKGVCWAFRCCRRAMMTSCMIRIRWNTTSSMRSA